MDDSGRIVDLCQLGRVEAGLASNGAHSGVSKFAELIIRVYWVASFDDFLSGGLIVTGICELGRGRVPRLLHCLEGPLKCVKLF